MYKRGELLYVDYRAGDRRIRKRAGTSKKTAELALRNIEVKLSQNNLVVVRDDKPIRSLLDEFMEYCRTNNSASTCWRYKAILDHFRCLLKVRFPSVHRLSQLNPRLFERYKTYRRNSVTTPNGRPLKRGKGSPCGKRPKTHTINIEIGGLRTVFGRAVQWGYLAGSAVTCLQEPG